MVFTNGGFSWITIHCLENVSQTHPGIINIKYITTFHKYTKQYNFYISWMPMSFDLEPKINLENYEGKELTNKISDGLKAIKKFSHQKSTLT